MEGMTESTVFLGAKGKFFLRRADGSRQRLGLSIKHGKLHVYDTRARAWTEVAQPIKYGKQTVKVEVYD